MVSAPAPSGAAGFLVEPLLKGLASSLLSAVTAWVITGTTALVASLAPVIDAAGRPDFGPGFVAVFAEVARVAAAFALPFLLLASIHALIRQDLSLLVRAVLVRMPVAFLLTGVASEVVSLALGITDTCCSALVHLGGTSLHAVIARLVVLLAGDGPRGALMSGFAGVVVALSAAVVALVLWIELALRSAAISVATLFLPLALVGLVWQATAHWARRLAEILAALVLAKLVVVGVLVLAARSLLAAGTGAGLVQGVALLLLAALSPFSLLRLVPILEAGAIGHLEGLARRGARAIPAAARGAAVGFEAVTQHFGAGGGVDDLDRRARRWVETTLSLSDPVVLAEARRFETETGEAHGGGPSEPEGRDG